MSPEIPTAALIHEIQLTLRREAGVPSYDPADPSIPTLPSIADAVAALDLSLPLRCGLCRGPLLRGAASTVCIFCGADRRRDAPAKTVSFNSTATCRSLLESLGLDGSEIVTFDTESGDSSKSKDTPKDVLVLSGLLDLELRWPLDQDETYNSSINKVPIQPPLGKEENSNGSPKNLFSQTPYTPNVSGVDLDSFLSDSNKDATSTAPGLSKELQLKHADDHVSPGSQTFGFFENVQFSDLEASTLHTNDGQFANSFADWDAGFQSATSEIFAVGKKPVDLFQGSSTVEFVSPAPEAFAASQKSDKEHNPSITGSDGEPRNDEGQLYSSDNWISDDIVSQISKEAVIVVNQFKGISETHNAEWKNGLHNDSWVQDDLWLSSSKKELNITKTVEVNDDLLDDWQDFTSSGDAQKGVSNSSAQYVVEASNAEELHNNTILDDNDDSYDAWQDFTSSGEALGGLRNSWSKNGIEVTTSGLASSTKSLDVHDMVRFVDSDSFTGVLVDQKGYQETNIMQLDSLVPERMNGTNKKSEVDSTIWEPTNVSENLTADQNLNSSTLNVEKLLSQMHDLSFMLEDSLSIPVKASGSGLNP